jgi:hypothetical protein
MSHRDPTIPPMPVGWVPPPMYQKCWGCKYEGDLVNEDFFVGDCMYCGDETCSKCGTVDGDFDGNMHTCNKCLKRLEDEEL